MLFNGLPEKNVSNVVVENSSIEARTGAQVNESTDVILRNVKITPQEGPALMINNAKNLKIENFKAPEGLPTVMQVTGSRNADIEIGGEAGDITRSNSTIVPAATKAVTIK